MTSEPQMPGCAGTSFTQPLRQGLASLSLFIPNQLISRQGKSLDYALASAFDKIMKKRGKDKGILIINFLHCRSFFHQSHPPIKSGARVNEPICML
jgi:hypothetical protein